MRILFFSNISFSPTAYNGGGWIFSLINELKNKNDIEIGVCYLGDEKKWTKFDGLFVYETQKLGRGSFASKANYTLNHYFGDYKKSERNSWSYYENQFLDVIKDFNPDIIHIFGSEKEFGLIGSKTTVPTILHIQGYINPYIQAYLPPFFSYNSLIKWCKLKDILSQSMLRRLWKMQAYRETEIFKRIDNYIGRTEWDKRITNCYRPDAHYFYGSEILRDTFYSGGNRVIPQKLTIVSTISGAPYKGFDLVLKTANVLKNIMHLDFDWKVFGNVNPEPFERVLKVRYKEFNILLLGVASADTLKNEILSSTCYVHPTYIDNSPNSVCEAQILGVPVVACNVGGVESLIEEGTSGLLVPANDPYQTAFLIKRLFCDSNLNKYIGSKSKEMSHIRHNKISIVNNLFSIYNDILIDEHN